jgi:uncharacterized protein YbjT (DUF2867 family)
MRSDTAKVCIVEASGKLGRYMVQHALDRGYELVRAGGTSRATARTCTRGRSKALVNVAGGLARLARLLKSNITRGVDFALFMVAALENDELVHEAPAIVGCQTPSALAHAAGE